jgi:hypothetical protein
MKPDRAKLLFLGAALIQGDLALDKRIDVLGKYLTPKPGEELRLDEFAEKEYGKRDKNRGVIYGMIEVAPPKGHCFNVTTSPDKPDIEVCKKTKLKWSLNELDRHTGRLKWLVQTGKGDFGTPIEWKTKYIIAKYIPSKYKFNEANSTPVFIKSCDAVAADPENFTGRRINLSLLAGETWILRFPDVDKPIPPPEAAKPAVVEEKKPAPEGGGQGEKTEGTEKKPSAKLAPPPVEPPEAWTLSTRRGFEMDVSNVIVGTATAPNTKGKCRYQYDRVIGNFDTGVIECHYGDYFLYLYSPIPCLKYIMPKK